MGLGLCVKRSTSHVTRHTSHVTRHTSHVTRYTLHVTRHLLRELPQLTHEHVGQPPLITMNGRFCPETSRTHQMIQFYTDAASPTCIGHEDALSLCVDACDAAHALHKVLQVGGVGVGRVRILKGFRVLNALV